MQKRSCPSTHNANIVTIFSTPSLYQSTATDFVFPIESIDSHRLVHTNVYPLLSLPQNLRKRLMDSYTELGCMTEDLQVSIEIDGP